MSVTFDFSNNAPYLLEIRHTQTDLAGNPKEEITILDATDEDGVAEWLSNQFGEKLHELNGCPLYMELSSWASLHAGEGELEYELEHYEGMDTYEVWLSNREE